jgi:putative flippase GtrA
MKKNTNIKISKKDFVFGVVAGFFMGILMMPILNAAKPELFEKIKFLLIPFFVIATPAGLYIASIISKKITILWQLAKFAVTGGLNFLVDLGILTFLIYIFRSYFSIDPKDVFVTIIAYYSLFKGASFILANINSYFWNKYWTFQKNESKNTGKEFFQFFLVSIIGLLINTGIASYVFKVITPFSGMNLDQWSLMGAVFGSIAAIAWNFIGYKFFVFKK